MKKTLQLTAARVLLALTAALLPSVSCNRESTIHDYPSADFQITITETRQTHVFTYGYDRALGRLAIDPSEQELQELWVTGWNEVVMTLDGLEPAFSGANAISSDPSVVRVKRQGGSDFRLEYVSNGSVTITVWTSDEYSYSFTVHAREVIELEHMLVSIGGREFRCPFRRYTYDQIVEAAGKITFQDMSRMGFMEDTCRFSLATLRLNKAGMPAMVQYTQSGLSPGGLRYDGTYFYEPQEKYFSDGALLEIRGLCPENASWRDVSLLFCEALEPSYDQESFAVRNGMTGFSLNYDCIRYGLPPFMKGSVERNLDFSEVKGRRAWLTRYWNVNSGTPDDVNATYPSHLVRVVIRKGYGARQPDRSKASLVYSYVLCWPEDPAFTFLNYRGTKMTL